VNRLQEPNDIDARVAVLPRPTLNDGADARIHARAREVYVASALDVTPAPEGRWERLWSSAFEPVAVAIATVVYLLWTTQALAAIDWGRIALR